MSSASLPNPAPWIIALGHAVTVLAACPRNRFRLAAVYHFLSPPARLGQILFAFDSQGAATGYVTWAFLSSEVAGALATDPDRLMDLGEWNEGCQLWIMDVVSPWGGSAALLRRLRAHLPDHDCVRWFRTDRAGRRARVRSAMLAGRHGR